MKTVFEAFMATAEAAAEHAFLAVPPAPGRAYHPDGIELTYGQVRADVLRHRERYAAAGYGHGHRVALLLENRPEFFFALPRAECARDERRAGQPRLPPRRAAYQMDHSEADLVVSIPGRVADLEAVARERGKPLPVVDTRRMAGARCRARGPRRAPGRPGSTPSAACSTPRAPPAGPRAAC